MAGSDGDLEIRLLGPVEVRRGGRLLAIGGRRQRHLLAVLAIEPGRTIAADRLIDELWAGEPTDGARVTLKVQVSRLRSALGTDTTIRGSTAGYALEVEPATVDAQRFEGFVGDARRFLARNPRRAAGAAAAAVGLWRGDPFGDLGGDLSGDLRGDGLLAGEAARLGELRLEALELRIAADLRLGRASEVVGELEALVREHPYRERAWRQLMLALYRSDRQADALAAYHRARRALRDELGVEPGEELQHLQAAILRHDVPADDAGAGTADRVGNLPAPLTSFIGRRTELAEIDRLLGEARLMTLTGVGGVGKTRLGLEVAHRAADRFADGAWFVDLARLAAPELVAGDVATAIGVPEDAATSPIGRLVGHFRDRQAVLVLDNCEHLIVACADLASRVLEGCPAVHVVATSRVPLGAPGETVYPVPPLSLAAGQADPESRSDAAALFLDRAGAASPGIEIDAAAADVVERICRDLDGLPLAIELAAARARSLAVPEIAQRLGDRFRFLVSWRRVATARHQTLREAMDWSYELLGPDERRLLERLAVFAGGFDLEAATAVSDSDDEMAILDRLERLMDASLVSARHPEVGPSRYGLLETVRQYAGERLVIAGAEPETRARHARHFLAMSLAAGGRIREGPDAEIWLARLAADRDNVRAALSWFRDAGAVPELLQMTESLWWFWWMRGEAAEGRAWLETAVAGQDPRDGDEEHLFLLAGALTGLAGLSWSQGDFDAAHAFALRAEPLFGMVGDEMRRGGVWNTIGVIEHGRADLAAARTAFERSIELMRSGAIDSEEDRGRRLAKPVDNLGSVLLDGGDLDGAVALYQEARRLHLEVGQGEEGALFDLHVAWAEILRGRHEVAGPLLARALEHFRGVGFLQYTTECLEGIGYVMGARENHADATLLLGASSALRERTHTPYWGRARDEFDRAMAMARAAMGAEATDLAFEAGRSDPEAAIDRAAELIGATSPA